MRDDDGAYADILAQAKASCAHPGTPAMPLTRITGNAIATACPSTAQSTAGYPQPQRTHDEHISPPGYVSPEWFAMVHTPVPMTKAMKLPAAKLAVDTEWNTLLSKGAWDL